MGIISPLQITTSFYCNQLNDQSYKYLSIGISYNGMFPHSDKMAPLKGVNNFYFHTANNITRSRNLFYLTFCRTNNNKNSPINRIVYTYNSKFHHIDMFHLSFSTFRNQIVINLKQYLKFLPPVLLPYLQLACIYY